VVSVEKILRGKVDYKEEGEMFRGAATSLVARLKK